MIKKIILCLVVVLPVIFAVHCGKTPEFKNLNPTFLHTTNQTIITPASGTQHAWSGLTIKNNTFTSTKNISKFILWQTKKDTKNLTIHYSLHGPPSDLYVNSKHKTKLTPKQKISPYSIEVPLNRGFNFIEFRQKGKSKLKIKEITVGETKNTPGSLLTEGRSITHYHSPGSGSISLRGKGNLHIRLVEFINGEKINRDKNFASKKVTHPFEFKGPGYLQITAETGEFDVTGYTFTEKKSPKVPLKTTLEGKPDIYIFLIDGCQAVHLGMYGYHRPTSPFVDELAKDSVVFENAYANATFTRSSVATIFTGFYPMRHKLRILTNVLPKGLFMMPEFLKKQGYKTSLITEAGNISKVFGFNQGVDHYVKAFWRLDDPRFLQNNVLKAFKSLMDKKQPLFSYVHYRAPHFPIVPPPPFKDMFLPRGKKPKKDEDRVVLNLLKLDKAGHKFTLEEVEEVVNDYDSAIRYVDAEVGKLITTLKKTGRYDSSFIIFTSDHGEAVYEHESWGHGHNVCEETSRVPLTVKFPKAMNIKGRVERVVQLTDIFPTFAGLMGEDRYFDGQSLLKSIEIKDLDDTFAFSTTFLTPPSISIRWRNWYYVIHQRRNNSEELFNLDEDRLKDISTLPENKDMLTFFRTKFIRWLVDFDNLERTSQSMDLKKLPKDEYENLKSLGYIN